MWAQGLGRTPQESSGIGPINDRNKDTDVAISSLNIANGDKAMCPWGCSIPACLVLPPNRKRNRLTACMPAGLVVITQAVTYALIWGPCGVHFSGEMC